MTKAIRRVNKSTKKTLAVAADGSQRAPYWLVPDQSGASRAQPSHKTLPHPLGAVGLCQRLSFAWHSG